MGALFGRIMDNDVGFVESAFKLVIGPLARGAVGEISSSSEFWAMVAALRGNPAGVEELRGFMVALIEEDWSTAAVLLDVVAGGLEAERRVLIVSLLRLPTVSLVLRSRAAWDMVLDDAYLRALLRTAGGGLEAWAEVLAHPFTAAIAAEIAPERRGALERVLEDALRVRRMLRQDAGRRGGAARVAVELLCLPRVRRLLRDERVAATFFTPAFFSSLSHRVRGYAARVGLARERARESLARPAVSFWAQLALDVLSEPEAVLAALLLHGEDGLAEEVVRCVFEHYVEPLARDDTAEVGGWRLLAVILCAYFHAALGGAAEGEPGEGGGAADGDGRAAGPAEVEEKASAATVTAPPPRGKRKRKGGDILSYVVSLVDGGGGASPSPSPSKPPRHPARNKRPRTTDPVEEPRMSPPFAPPSHARQLLLDLNTYRAVALQVIASSREQPRRAAAAAPRNESVGSAIEAPPVAALLQELRQNVRGVCGWVVEALDATAPLWRARDRSAATSPTAGGAARAVEAGPAGADPSARRPPYMALWLQQLRQACQLVLRRGVQFGLVLLEPAVLRAAVDVFVFNSQLTPGSRFLCPAVESALLARPFAAAGEAVAAGEACRAMVLDATARECWTAHQTTLAALKLLQSRALTIALTSSEASWVAVQDTRLWALVFPESVDDARLPPHVLERLVSWGDLVCEDHSALVQAARDLQRSFDSVFRPSNVESVRRLLWLANPLHAAVMQPLAAEGASPPEEAVRIELDETRGAARSASSLGFLRLAHELSCEGAEGDSLRAEALGLLRCLMDKESLHAAVEVQRAARAGAGGAARAAELARQVESSGIVQAALEFPLASARLAAALLAPRVWGDADGAAEARRRPRPRGSGSQPRRPTAAVASAAAAAAAAAAGGTESAAAAAAREATGDWRAQAVWEAQRSQEQRRLVGVLMLQLSVHLYGSSLLSRAPARTLLLRMASTGTDQGMRAQRLRLERVLDQMRKCSTAAAGAAAAAAVAGCVGGGGGEGEGEGDGKVTAPSKQRPRREDALLSLCLLVLRDPTVRTVLCAPAFWSVVGDETFLALLHVRPEASAPKPAAAEQHRSKRRALFRAAVRTAGLDGHRKTLLRLQAVARHARFREVMAELNSDGSLAAGLAALCGRLAAFFRGPEGRALAGSVGDDSRASAAQSLARPGGLLDVLSRRQFWAHAMHRSTLDALSGGHIVRLLAQAPVRSLVTRSRAVARLQRIGRSLRVSREPGSDGGSGAAEAPFSLRPLVEAWAAVRALFGTRRAVEPEVSEPWSRL